MYTEYRGLHKTCILALDVVQQGGMAAAGYSITFFMDAIDRSHYCGLCKQVLRGPVTTKCGHTHTHIYIYIVLAV